MRENFETAYYLGGDDHSGALLLDMSKKELMDFLTTHSITLGQGLCLLRNNAVAPQARLVRVGMASNEAIWYLLGRADGFTLPEAAALSGDADFPRPEGGPASLKGRPEPREQRGFPFREGSGVPSRRQEREARPPGEGFPSVTTGELVGEVKPLQKEVPGRDAETSQTAEDGKYRFSDAEKPLVIELYKAYKSIDKVLAHFNRGGRWHKDASHILKEAGLL
jgi:hypothetical protein